ncbi:MAG: DUF370 domain-containing protein [Tissierellia bacterium]|jgi:hypothetical protein|nr:DUF370 domain-containing protein [Tissierellia bacterium]
MIIHIGDNIALLESDIVAILDIDTVLESEDNYNLIQNLIKKDCLVNYTNDNIKSYIITSDTSKGNYKGRLNSYKLYTSNISSTSLLKRIYTKE